MTHEEISTLLDKAEEHLDKSEHPQAEKLANEVLASAPERNDDAAWALCILGDCCLNTSRSHNALTHFEEALALTEKESNLPLQARAVSGRATVQATRGESTTALISAERSVELAKKAQDKKQQARAFHLIGSLYVDRSDYPLALQYFQQAILLSEETGKKQYLAKHLNSMGVVYNYLSDYHQAIECLTRSRSIAEEIGNKQSIALCLYNFGISYNALGEYEKALECSLLGLALGEEMGNKHQVALFLANMGRNSQQLGNHNYALESSRRALALHEEIDDKRYIPSLLNDIANVYSDLADYSSELDFRFKCLALNEENGDKHVAVHTLGNIGNAYRRLSDHDRAFEYLFRALALAEEIGDKAGVAVNVGNIGNTYYELADFTRSLEYSRRALVLSKEIGERRQMGYWMLQIASAERKLGHLDTAYEGLLACLHLRRDELQSQEGIAYTLLELGRVLIEMGRYEEGLAQLEEAMALAEELGEKKTAEEAQKELADAYAKKGDIAKAFEYLQKHYTLKEAIFSEESRKKVEQFNMRVAIAEKEGETEVQRVRAEHLEQHLALQASSMAAQAVLVEHFRRGVRDAARKLTDPINALKEIQAMLRDLPKQEINWTKFDADFTQAHPEFRTKLLEKYPTLSEAELRLCMMVKLGLKTPDIARLLYLSERTIEGHRLNARKKMALKNGETIATRLTQL